MSSREGSRRSACLEGRGTLSDVVVVAHTGAGAISICLRGSPLVSVATGEPDPASVPPESLKFTEDRGRAKAIV